MPQCKWCKKKGMFLKVYDGLCAYCLPKIKADAENSLNRFQQSYNLFKTSKKIDTKLSRYGIAVTILEQDLIPYEEQGINILSSPTSGVMPPSQVLKELRNERTQLLNNYVKETFDEAMSKSQASPTAKKKIGELDKGFLKFAELRRLTSISKKIETLIEKYENENTMQKQKIQIEHFLEEAQKAEYKEQRKKALEQYLEASFLLNKDDILLDDKEELLKTINKKIEELKKG